MKISEQMKEAQAIIEGMESKGISDQDMKAIAATLQAATESFIKFGEVWAKQQKAISALFDNFRANLPIKEKPKESALKSVDLAKISTIGGKN